MSGRLHRVPIPPGTTAAWLAGVLLLAGVMAGCSGNSRIEIMGGGGTVTLAMIPSDPTPAEQSFVAITVVIENAENVVSAPFKILYDETRVEFVDATVGPFLGSEGDSVSFLTGTDPTHPGVLSVGMAILGAGPDSGVSGIGDLCTLRFEILPGAAGGGDLTLEPFSFRIFQPGLEEVPATFAPLTLTPVP